MDQNMQLIANASAAQPSRAHLPLSTLLILSSTPPGGTWEVYSCHPIEDKYKFMEQGQLREGTNFRCTLVCPRDPSLYCQAQIRKTRENAAEYRQALNACRHGASLVMSKVGLIEGAKKEYNSCPIKRVVDLSKTTLDPGSRASDSAVQPAPTTTVAECIRIGTPQFFDISALIQEVGPLRIHDNNRSSFLVTIHDGSLDITTHKIRTMTVIMYPTSHQVPLTQNVSLSSAEPPATTDDMKLFLEEQLRRKKAVSFFSLSGAQDTHGKFSFRTTTNTFLTKAVGTKADRLNSDAALHNLQVTDTVNFERQAVSLIRDRLTEAGKGGRKRKYNGRSRDTAAHPGPTHRRSVN